MNFTRKQFTIDSVFLHSWQPYFWFIIISFLLFSPVFTFSEYTYLDDHFLIVESFSHIDNWSDIGHTFLEDVTHQGQGGSIYRPLLMISFIISAQISGVAPFGYHLIDILLHIASCCLLFAALQILGFKRSSSFWGTLFFCIHPMVNQAVAWIPGRNDSLLAVFILSGFITYIKYFSSFSKKWYILHLLFFLLAMLTKESAIVFPLLALLYSFSFKREKILSLTTVLFLAGWGIIILNWQVMRIAAMITPVGDKLQAVISILANSKIILFYLGKIFWPFDLAFAPILDDVHITTGIISLGFIGVLLFCSERKDWKMVFFSMVWFILFLIPTFFKMPKFCEHRIYIPSMGILFILLSLSFTKMQSFLKRIIPFILAAVFCILGWISYNHTFYFKNYMSMIEYDAKSSPNDLGRYNIITRMLIPDKLKQKISSLQGISQLPNDTSISVPIEKLWSTIEELNNELKSNQNDPELHHALAITYFARGFFVSSETNFLAAMQNSPQNANIPYNIGILYYRTYERRKAEQSWFKTLEIDSSMNKAHLNLSYLYYETGQYDLAWLHCQKAIQSGITVFPVFIDEIKKKLL